MIRGCTEGLSCTHLLMPLLPSAPAPPTGPKGPGTVGCPKPKAREFKPKSLAAPTGPLPSCWALPGARPAHEASGTAADRAGGPAGALSSLPRRGRPPRPHLPVMGPTGPDPSHPSLEAPAWWLGHLPEGHAWSLRPENTGPEVYNLHIPSLGKVICRASAPPTLRLPVYFFLSAHRGPAPPSTAATAEAPSCPQGAASSGLRSGLLGRARGQLVTVGLLQPRRPGPPICGASESVLLPWGGGGGRRQSPGHPNISRVRGPRRLLPGVRWSQPSGWSSSVQGFSKRGLDAAVINQGGKHVWRLGGVSG